MMRSEEIARLLTPAPDVFDPTRCEPSELLNPPGPPLVGLASAQGDEPYREIEAAA